MEMKNALACGFVLVALTAPGWSSASTLDVAALCGENELLSDSGNRVYRGQFEDGGVALEHALVVTPMTLGGETVVLYVWGEQPQWNVPEAGCRFGTGAEKGDALTVYWENIRVAYQFSGDEASVQYTWSGWTRNGTLTRSRAVARPVKQVAKTSSAPEPVKKASSTVVPAKKASTSVVSARRITTEQEYRDVLVGKKLANKQGYSITHGDGTIGGKFGKAKLKGKWTWEGEYFCRTAKLGNRILEPDCQTVVVAGNRATFARQKGKGNKSTWRIE